MDRENGKHPAGGTPKKSRPKKPKKPSRLTRQQKLLIAVAVVLAIVLIAVVACQSLFVRPDLPDKNADADSETQEEEIDWGEGTRPRSDGERKSQDYYTVLILGRDTGGGGNTDTMLLASYDVTNQKATVMSIPRDTMVNVSWDIKRINSVYNYYGGGDRGIQYLYKEIAQLVGFEPDYQVVVEWDAVGQIVDAMGGVWFDVPRNMNYDDPYQDLHIHQEKGYRLLTGDDAMQVLRYRHDNDMRYGYPDGDLGRIKTQQGLLKAMIEQLMSLKNIAKVNEFIKVFNENVETDLSFQNMLWFAKQAFLGNSSGAKLDTAQVNFVTMPNKNVSCWSRVYHSYQSYVTPNAQELLELVEALNGREDIDGILVQLPLPRHLDEKAVLLAIRPDKDVDCFHPFNVGQLMIGEAGFQPCTPAGVMRMLKEYGIDPAGKHCVIVGRSNIVGKPQAMLMLRENATVTVCHTKTRNLKEECLKADILVAAAGRAGLISGDMVKEGAVVVDVAMNRSEAGKLCGDVVYDEAAERASYITPVPGGVGPMTRAMLMENTLYAARQHGKR